MATTAALLAVSMTGAKSNHMSTSLEHKRKNQESLMSTRKEQPDQNDQSKPADSSASPIDGINNEEREIRANGVRPNGMVSRIPMKKLKNQTSSKPNLSVPSNSQPLKSKSSPSNDLSTSDSQPQEGKRKLSLSQYKEHKRLKSSDTSDNVPTDVDMRVYAKPPSPMETNECSTVGQNHVESTVSKNLLLDIGSNKKSNLIEPGLRNIVKKKVIWADERQQELVQTSFFEIDDCERMNKRSFAHQFENSISIAQIEKLQERNFRQQQSFQDFDDRPALPSLPPLIRIHLPSTLPTPVVKSHQRIIQEERERTVLQALLIGSFVPDSPAEPDSESTEDSIVETKLIPLEDDASAKKSDNSQVITTSSNMIPTESNASTNINIFGTSNSVSPQVAQILAVARGNLTSTTVNPQPNPVPSVATPALPIQPTPNLLALLVGAQNANIPPVNPFANLLSSLTLPINPLANSWLSPMHQILTNRLPMPPPVAQNQLTQTLPSSFNQPLPSQQTGPIETSTSEPDSTRFNSFAHNQPSSNFQKKNFHHRGNPNNRKQHFRRGPNNGQRRNLYSNRNTFA